jgi:N-acetylglutamate synthase-like GNAT family acetyltransferase
MTNESSATPVRIVSSPNGFSDWAGLHSLLRAAYAYMDGRIDPPSSLLRMSAGQLEDKARHETLILAVEGEQLRGCAFASRRSDCLYVGKLAVHPDFQRKGIARRLLAEAEALARAASLQFVELETRVELHENHQTFAALGFRRTAETSHPGHARPTSITMRKALTA